MTDHCRTLDGAGILASTLCALHCLALPLLLGSLSFPWLRHPVTEWTLLSVSVMFGLSSLLPAYRRLHRKRICLFLFWVGACSLAAGKYAAAVSLPDTPYIVAGATLIVSAHALNRYLCSRCACCEGMADSQNQ